MPEQQRVLVTGANGLLGANIVALLGKDSRYKVRAMVRKNADLRSLQGTSHELFVGKITDPADLENALRGCSYVIHCAARTSHNPSALKYYIEANIKATEYLIDLCRKHSINRFVFVSTTNCFTNGSLHDPGTEEGGFMPWLKKSGYAYSKYIAQQKVLMQVEKSRFPAVVVAPGFLVGPRDAKPSSGQLLLYIARNKLLFCPPGGKSFVDARYAASAIIEALVAGKPGDRWLITGQNMTYRQFYQSVATLQGKKKIIVSLPTFLLKIIAVLFSFGETITGKSFPFNITQQRLICLDNYFSNEKARKELGLLQTNIKEAVRSSLEWFRQYGYNTGDANADGG